eukprot:m.3770 g.3770  ORF g.3770 m.3770 type:complete len:334 (+) comp9787_c0_seq1:98-1099(+)
MDDAAVVIDIGSYQSRAGFAGEERPCCVLSTSELLLSDARQGASANQVVDASQMDADELGILWDRMVVEELRAIPRECPCLLTEPAGRSKTDRERIAEVWFERMEIPSVYVASQPLLALYSTGKTSGMVLYSGEHSTDLFPVWEGKSVSSATSTLPVGGHDVTNQLGGLLRPDDVTLSRGDVRHLKERYCFVASGEATIRGVIQECTLPDGRVIELGDEQHLASEVFFGQTGLHQAFVSVVQKTDKKGLMSHVVFAGGASAMAGFNRRMLLEIEGQDKTVHSQLKLVPGVSHSLAAWIGGSVIASLGPCWQDIWVTREMYEEFGSSVINRKLF